MRILKLILLFVFLFTPNVFYAQTKIESKEELYHRLSTAKEDTVKIDILQRLSLFYFEANVDSLKYFGDQILALSEKLKYDRGLEIAHRCFGLYYEYKGDRRLAEINYLK